jgi:hypothetical protein
MFNITWEECKADKYIYVLLSEVYTTWTLYEPGHSLSLSRYLGVLNLHKRVSVPKGTLNLHDREVSVPTGEVNLLDQG